MSPWGAPRSGHGSETTIAVGTSHSRAARNIHFFCICFLAVFWHPNKPPKISEIKVFHDNDLIFSKEDCSNLAQAKAANYCGQVILMRVAGVDPIDIEKLHLAGAFANYVNLNNAMENGEQLPINEVDMRFWPNWNKK